MPSRSHSVESDLAGGRGCLYAIEGLISRLGATRVPLKQLKKIGTDRIVCDRVERQVVIVVPERILDLDGEHLKPA